MLHSLISFQTNELKRLVKKAIERLHYRGQEKVTKLRRRINFQTGNVFGTKAFGRALDDISLRLQSIKYITIYCSL